MFVPTVDGAPGDGCSPDVLMHGSVKVTDVALEAVTALAQWMSLRILSSASRAFVWAWKRLFMSSSAFEPCTKTVVIPVITIDMIAITVISSTMV